LSRQSADRKLSLISSRLWQGIWTSLGHPSKSHELEEAVKRWLGFLLEASSKAILQHFGWTDGKRSIELNHINPDHSKLGLAFLQARVEASNKSTFFGIWI